MALKKHEIPVEDRYKGKEFEVKEGKRAKAYHKIGLFKRSIITPSEKTEGELLQDKISRIMRSGEPIKDGAPEIFTEKKDGVIPGYNIRTDRWELATDAMDLISKNEIAKADNKGAEVSTGEEPGTPGESAEAA